MLKKLSHLCLGTSDLPKSLAFYRDLLGCQVAHEFRNQQGELYGVFLLVGDGTFLEIFNNQQEASPGGLFRHLCFEVENIQTLAEQLRLQGYQPEINRGRTDRVLQCWIEDPDGHQVEFQQFDEESKQYRILNQQQEE